MATNVGNMAFKLVSQYDNTGVKLAMKDMTDSQKMIAGMSAASPRVDPLMAKLGASNNAELALGAGDKSYWMERARQRDQDVAEATQANNIAIQEATRTANQIMATDRAYWVERSRQRDQDLRDEIQSNNIATQEAQRAANEKAAADEAAWKQMLARKSAAMLDKSASGPGGLEALPIDMAAERRKEADRSYWAERGRNRDRDSAAAAASAKTEWIMQAARVTSEQTRDRAAQQRITREVEDIRLRQAMERSRHDQVMSFIFQEGDAAAGVARGGINRGSTTADNNMRNRGFVGAMALQQGGFMVQDFQSQMMNAKTTAEGFGRGMMAISNNIQMLGAAFGPTALAISSIGGAAAGIIVPAVARWLDDSKAVEERTKAIEASYTSLKSMVSGLRDVAEFGGGLVNGENAQKKIDSLTGQRSAATRESALIRKKIDEEMAGGNDQAVIGGLRKHLAEVNDEYDKANIRLQAIQEQWTPVRLKEAKDRLDQLKKDKEAEKIIEEDNEKSMMELKRQQADELKAEDYRIQHQYDVRQNDLRNKIDDLNKMGTQSNGSSSASVRGTSAAASAISRALAGTKSEENDRKHQIKVLEDQLKTLNRLEQKMNFKKAGLLPA